MLLQENPALEELALKVLIQEPGASAKRVWQLLQDQGRAYTLRGVYKELSKLVDQGILFKRGETYNVRLAWVMNLLALGDLAYDQYTHPAYLSTALGDGEGKLKERFSDLRKLDRLWTQLILTLHKLHPGKVMCFWVPYQWFYLAHYFTVKQFYEAIDLAGHKRCHIIGSDTYLSRKALTDLPKGGKYSLAKSPFDAERSTYYTVIADRVITVKLDQQITSKIHELFYSVRSDADLRAQEVESIFGSKIKGTVMIERNEKKAERLKKIFADFFGMEIL